MSQLFFNKAWRKGSASLNRLQAEAAVRGSRESARAQHRALVRAVPGLDAPPSTAELDQIVSRLNKR